MVLTSSLEDSNADVVLFCVRYNYERNSIQSVLSDLVILP